MSKPVSLSVNRRKELAGAQNPSAMILSCADSRLPPELVFNAGLGDLFVIRSLGGVVDRSVLAAIEYGAARLRVPLLVVMGHESCDVVKAAGETKGAAESANLDYLKAIQTATHEPGRIGTKCGRSCWVTWSRSSTTPPTLPAPAGRAPAPAISH